MVRNLPNTPRNLAKVSRLLIRRSFPVTVVAERGISTRTKSAQPVVKPAVSAKVLDTFEEEGETMATEMVSVYNFWISRVMMSMRSVSVAS